MIEDVSYPNEDVLYPIIKFSKGHQLQHMNLIEKHFHKDIFKISLIQISFIYR